MSHNTLIEYFRTSHALHRHHGWNMDEIENRTPFDLNIYIALLDADLKEEERIARENANK